MWKQIEECKNYEVNECGEVRNKKTLRVLAKVMRRGYVSYKLTNNEGERKVYLAHRLAAIAFIPNPLGYEIVNHRDENKENNNISNLEWCDTQYNNNYGTRTSRAVANNPQKVKVVCQETNTIYDSMSEASRMTGAGQQNISKVCRGERKTAGGYHWCYWKEGEANA